MQQIDMFSYACYQRTMCTTAESLINAYGCVLGTYDTSTEHLNFIPKAPLSMSCSEFQPFFKEVLHRASSFYMDNSPIHCPLVLCTWHPMFPSTPLTFTSHLRAFRSSNRQAPLDWETTSLTSGGVRQHTPLWCGGWLPTVSWANVLKNKKKATAVKLGMALQNLMTVPTSSGAYHRPYSHLQHTAWSIW